MTGIVCAGIGAVAVLLIGGLLWPLYDEALARLDYIRTGRTS